MKLIPIIGALLALALFSSCNKDDIIEESGQAPKITLDSSDGVYTVKVGSQLTIAPKIENAQNAVITWTLDDQAAGEGTTFTMTWYEEGVHYLVLTVVNDYGRAEEEMRIEVSLLTPPVVSLKIPSEGLKVAAGTDYLFSPVFQHDDLEPFAIEWFVDGVSVGNEKEYVFNEQETGTYHVRIVASNSDGTSETEFDVEVVDTMPCVVEFPTPYYTSESTVRYVFPGRAVCLTPRLENFDDPQFSWSVDGSDADCQSRTYRFTPTSPGEYLIEVTVSEAEGSSQAVSDDITRGAYSVTQQVTVVCVSASESDRMRPASGSSSPYVNKVYEYAPAPGQYIGDTQRGGMTGNETTFESANAWALSRLQSKGFVSLGGFGGYVIVGFDHSIASSGGDYDFAIQGNAFNATNSTRGSNEPGIVWVMQDVNGNGLPDDEWYELKGSQTGVSSTIQDYAVTYFRPAGSGMDVQWTDSQGQEGSIGYVGEYHSQDYYYPAWITAQSYTLRGTCLPANNHFDTSNGYWSSDPYGWGYADNMGSDALSGSDTTDGSGQRNGFKISNAICSDGTAANLQYIDFIKVQTGVNAQSGWLGEISTEVVDFQDLSLAN